MKPFYLVILFVFIAACSDKQGKDTVGSSPSHQIVVNLTDQIYQLHPPSLENKAEYQIGFHIFERLFKNKKPNNRLIKSIKQDSLGLFNIITVRSNVTFSDGSLITPEILKDWSASLPGLQTEGFTIKIPVSNYTNQMSNLGSLNYALYKKDENIFLGTGPWKIIEWNESISLTVSRNVHFKDKAPGIKEIQFRFIENKAMEIEEFQKGNIDLIELNPEQYLNYATILDLNQYPDFLKEQTKKKRTLVGIINSADSLDAYYLSKAFDDSVKIYAASDYHNPISFPDLPDRTDIREALMQMDSSIFTKEVSEKLNTVFRQAKQSNRKTNLPEISFYTIKHLEQQDPIEIISKKIGYSYRNQGSTYICILNSWSGFLVYQYYIRNIDYFNDTIYNFGSVTVEKPEVLE